DDRLRGQVEHALDLVLGQHALDEQIVGDVARGHVHALDDPLADQPAPRHAITHDGDDVCTARQEPFDEPPAEKSGRAGDEHGTIAPHIRCHPPTPSTAAGTAATPR